jgi:hypothetical protein
MNVEYYLYLAEHLPTLVERLIMLIFMAEIALIKLYRIIINSLTAKVGVQ